MQEETVPVEFHIVRQGAPIATYAHLVKQSKSIALIEVDMRSKHCEFNGHGEGDDGEIQINISATEATSIIHGDDNDIDTLIQLEDYNGNDGWEVFCGMVTKYTVKLTLIKREK